MELCSILCASLHGRGAWGRTDTCVCMAESLHCSPELITTLLISSTPIQNVFGHKLFIFKFFFLIYYYYYYYFAQQLESNGPFKCCLPFPQAKPAILFLLLFSIFYCKIIALQFCVGFYCTTKQNRRKYTHIPSLVSLPSFLPSHHFTSSQSAGLGSLYYTVTSTNFLIYSWYICQCYSFGEGWRNRKNKPTVLNKIHKAPQQPHPPHLVPLYLLFPVLKLNYHHFFLMPLSFHVSGSAHAIVFACNLFSFPTVPSLTQLIPASQKLLLDQDVVSTPLMWTGHLASLPKVFTLCKKYQYFMSSFTLSFIYSTVNLR